MVQPRSQAEFGNTDLAMNAIKQLGLLFEDLQEKVELARQLESPGTDAEMAIKMAIIGFSHR